MCVLHIFICILHFLVLSIFMQKKYFEFELLGAQPCWFALYKWRPENSWLVTYFIPLPNRLLGTMAAPKVVFSWLQILIFNNQDEKSNEKLLFFFYIFILFIFNSKFVDMTRCASSVRNFDLKIVSGFCSTIECFLPTVSIRTVYYMLTGVFTVFFIFSNPLYPVIRDRNQARND